MKISQILFASCAAAMFFTSACKSDKPAGDPEMFRVENFLRPRKIVKDIKSADMLYKIETDRDSEVLVRIRYRAPNRFRMDLSMKKLHVAWSVEGPTKEDKKLFKGWCFDLKDGMKELPPEEVKGILKETLRFPFLKYGLASFFTNSDKIGTGILNHESCWLFTCQPEPFKTKEQLCIWVGQETKQVRLVEVGVEKVVQFFDYEDFGGLKLPRHIYESGKDGVSKTTLVSAVWNKKIPLSVFLPPVTEKTIKLEDGRTFVDPVLIEKTNDSVTFAHKNGLVTLALKDLSPDTVKKISENDAAARKLLEELEAKEALEAKEEAERAAKEKKEKKSAHVVEKKAPRELSEGEKKQNALRDAILKLHVKMLEKRLADQKKSGTRSPRPAQYGFFTAGPHFFRDRYIRYHDAVSKSVKKADKKAEPVVDKKADKKAEPVVDKKADKKAEPVVDKKAAPAADKK